MEKNDVLHANGTPGFQHNSSSNVERVLNTLSDRYFTVKAMSINRGTNKGRDAVPNGAGGRITLVPVLCVCPEGSKDVFKATVVRPDGPNSYVGYGVGNGNVQGFDDQWRCVSSGNDVLRSISVRKWIKMSDEQKDTLTSLANLRSALVKMEAALGADHDLCTPLRQKIEEESKTVKGMTI